MLDPAHVPPVEEWETLGRFVLSSSHYRKSDFTVKPEAFMPHPHIELSLTRHRDASLEEVRNEGRRIAAIQGRSLYGQAMIDAASFRLVSLEAVAKPIPENPNHCDVVGWSPEKSEQKLAALEIAKRAKFELIPQAGL